MNIDWTSLSIVGPALLAGVLVLATHVPLGREVLKRGIIFIDLAVAQMAGLGVIAAGGFGFETHGVAAQVAAFASALAGGLLLSWTDRLFGRVQEDDAVDLHHGIVVAQPPAVVAGRGERDLHLDAAERIVLEERLPELALVELLAQLARLVGGLRADDLPRRFTQRLGSPGEQLERANVLREAFHDVPAAERVGADHLGGPRDRPKRSVRCGQLRHRCVRERQPGGGRGLPGEEPRGIKLGGSVREEPLHRLLASGPPATKGMRRLEGFVQRPPSHSQTGCGEQNAHAGHEWKRCPQQRGRRTVEEHVPARKAVES